MAGVSGKGRFILPVPVTIGAEAIRDEPPGMADA